MKKLVGAMFMSPMKDPIDRINTIPIDKMIHVVPNNDQHEHTEEGYKCLCNPKLRIENEHLIIIHNSYDGRELYEQNAIIN